MPSYTTSYKPSRAGGARHSRRNNMFEFIAAALAAIALPVIVIGKEKP